MLHFSHFMLHQESQQTPSTHLPLTHSESPLHDRPLMSLHMLVMKSHAWFGAQSEGELHAVRQAPERQTKGVQSWVPLSWQVPLPLQVWDLSRVVLPLHDAATQSVPEG
jgi:hypothetical protein